MQRFCYSCCAPLDMPDFQGPAENYCKHCTDEKGNLKSFDEVKKAVSEWFKMWQPNLNEEKAETRASIYLKSMPAWAD